MRFSTLFEHVRVPFTVSLSLAVGAVGFMPVEATTADQVQAQRVIATPVPVPIFVPAEMEIPRIGVRAPVVPVGTEADGKMAAPVTGDDVGWWSGRRPGEGNALFDAHVDWSGRPGPFARLGELEPGDEVIVRGRGGQMTYRITWLRKMDRNIDATELLGNRNGAQVATLITCFGPFDRSIGTRRDRLVARAELSA
ncbi:MAG TPA: class F sortase [Actinomycetota bacterium]|jgi:LPXTG-site transpeptidase (sortase) family protein|nr:class F sortase [Actinomycetota bacterium]